MNEFELIDWIRAGNISDPFTIAGPGDDCALIRMDGCNLVISTDAVTEGVHFEPGTAPERIGWKAAASSLSDIAASGSIPAGMVAACLFPAGTSPETAQGIISGLRAVCGEFGIGLAGGDIVRTRGSLGVVVTVYGREHSDGMLTRRGARDGDAVLVTGALGGSIFGRHLACMPRIPESLRIRELCRPSAMIDISDGLWSELNHIAAGSGVGILVDPQAIPVADEVLERYPDRREQLIHALSDGEDYELLFTLAPLECTGLEAGWNFAAPLTRIGTCASAFAGVRFEEGDVTIDPADLKPYSHAF